MKTDPKIKQALHVKCIEFVEDRLKAINDAIRESLASGNDETKSSAGDKHETSRSMAQLEQEKNSIQLNTALKLKSTLLKINPDPETKTISPGNLVITDNGNFYIAVAAGKIKVGDKEYFAVSADSPIGKALAGHSVGEEIDFNGKIYIIKTIL